MKWSVSFPEESILLVRPCLIAICHDNRPAAKLLSVLLYRHSIRQEHQSDAESINEVRGDDSQDITFRIYRKQSKLVTDMCNEITEKTLHDVAVPVLQLLGYLDVDETPTIHCYDLHVDVVVKALEAYKQGPKQLQQTLQSNLQLEKFLINIQLEKVLINKKNFQLALEKVLIANRNTSNNKRGRKPKPEAPREPQSEEPQINIEIDSKIGNREESVGSGEPTAPTSENVVHIHKWKEESGKQKAVVKGEVHVTTDHSTDSTLLPGEHHSDTVSEDICKTRQDDGASSTGHAQEAESELNTPSSLGTLAPAQRSESLSPKAAVQGADKRKRKTTQAIEPEAVRIMDDWDSLFKRPSPRTDNHIKAAESLIASNPTKEDLDSVRKFCFSSNPDWYRNKGVTLIDVSRNFGKWQSLQEEPIPITSKAEPTPSNGINHERNQRYSEELRKRFEENGPRLKGLKLRHG